MLCVVYWCLLAVLRSYKIVLGFIENLRKILGHPFILTVYIYVAEFSLLILSVCALRVAHAISLIVSG